MPGGGPNTMSEWRVTGELHLERDGERIDIRFPPTLRVRLREALLAIQKVAEPLELGMEAFEEAADA